MDRILEKVLGLLKEKNLDKLMNYVSAYPHILHYRNKNGETLIYRCAESGILSERLYKIYITLGIEINPVTDYGCSLFFKALESCIDDVVEIMIDLGAKMTEYEEFLFYAHGTYDLYSSFQEINHYEKMKQLVEKYPDLLSKKSGEGGMTILHHCAHCSQTFDICKYLIEKGANINAISYSGRSILGMVSFLNEEEKEFYNYLVSLGANLTPLEKLRNVMIDPHREEEAIHFLKNNRKYIFGLESIFQSPWLSIVIRYTHSLDMLNFLLEQGVFIDTICSDNKTPLHYAVALNPAKSDKKGIVTLLLDYGADVNAKDSRGFTPLHYAASGVNIDSTGEVNLSILLLLIGKGADVNALTYEGITPLCLALESRLPGFKKIVEYLKSIGGVSKINNLNDFEFGDDPLDW